MSKERADAISGLYEFAAGKGLYGKGEIITYGYIPALSFYLQMPPAFNSWPDLESYSEDIMRGNIEEYINKSSVGSADMPLIVISTDYSDLISAPGPSGNGKLDSIKQLIEAGGYSSVYKNGMFEAYYPDN